MTADERESSILAMLEALRFARPRDMEELTLWTDGKDAVTGQGISLPAPIFKDSE